MSLTRRTWTSLSGSHVITHHASQTGLQNFSHKGNHVQQLLLSFHVGFQQQRLHFQVLRGGQTCITQDMKGTSEGDI